MHHPVRTFLLHFLAMLVAMGLGMVLLFPLWVRAIRGADATSWLLQVETQSLAMATAMTLPAVVWMRIRRHRWLPTVEMALAMYAGFVVLFPFYWSEMITGTQLILVGHVLMALFMLLAMLARRKEYTGHRQQRPVVPARS